MNIEELKSKVGAGDAAAQYKLGVMCYYVIGVPQDNEEKLEYWLNVIYGSE